MFDSCLPKIQSKDQEQQNPNAQQDHYNNVFESILTGMINGGAFVNCIGIDDDIIDERIVNNRNMSSVEAEAWAEAKMLSLPRFQYENEQERWSALHTAAAQGKTEFVRRLLEKKIFDVNLCGPCNRTPLLLASGAATCTPQVIGASGTENTDAVVDEK